MSFRLKTILGIALIELSVMAILIIVNQLNLGGTASSQLYERVRGTGNLFAHMVADAVISTDLATLDAMIENTLEEKEIIYIRVRDASGTVLAANGDSQALAAPFIVDPDFDAALQDHRIDISAPVAIAGQSFGSIEIGVSTSRVEAEMAGALTLNMIVAGLGVALVALFGYLLGSVLTAQLSSLREGANMIARGHLGHQIDVRGRDELADTAKCFNEMATTLARDRMALETKQAELLEKRDRAGQIVHAMTRIAAGGADIPVPDCALPDEIGDMARATVVFQNAMNEVQQARAEQARLIHAFDQLEEQVAIFGQDGNSIFLNSAFRQFNAEVLGDLPPSFSYADFLNAGLARGVFPGAAGQEDNWLERRLADDPGDGLPVEVARAPDRTLLVRCTTVTGTGMVVSASDVTELKSSQAQLIQASKLATLGEMATGIAHELNQPLGVIRMASSNCIKRITKGQLDAEYLTGKLQRMADQTERASQIINHMRIFGRTADGHDRCFALNEALKNACDLMQTQFSSAGVALTLETGETEVQAHGQQVMFEQVILNLLANARDAIESAGADSGGIEGGGAISVSLVSHDAEQVSVIVQDNGGGVPEHVLDRLFDPFFTTKEPGKGTGLGLSISYGIIRDMGGSIAATNTDEGARFRIDLPVAKPASSTGSATAVA